MAVNLVQNPGFETGDFTSWTVGGTISTTNPDTLNIGVDSDPSDVHSGNFGVFAGNAYTTTLSQTIPTVIGATYSVSFYLDVYQADATDGAMTASFGATQFENLVEPAETDQFTQYTASIKATTSATNLEFTFNDPPGYFGFDDASVIQTSVCFASGTRIRVARSSGVADVPVERLVVGDLVVTASGERRRIRWLGHRTVECRDHPRPHEARPVRIAAHAFGDHRPARDLYVSPAHSICVDVLGEVLIPAEALVDGSIVAQVEVDRVIYWHVELDSHDILVADGLPAESYLEMGNRAFFKQGTLVDFAALPDAATATHADFCRPFHDRGPVVEAVRHRLRSRAAELANATIGDVAAARARPA